MINPPPNEEPWRICYRALAPKLLLFARQWLPAQADAEDALQTAFVKFWRHQPDAGPEHYPLLYAAVRTSALDLLRGRERRSQRETELAADEAWGAEPYFDHPLERREDASAIDTAMQTLPAEQREVLVLRVWGELTFSEIAATLGASINTVASRHRYALEALRKVLKPYEPARLRV